ncbi:glycosyltransferase (plasmid) [Tistrella bauzanensis]|uniref:CgeB family protein n=1 Tax=Tistrella TaxID=171436 RepID=UPI0031F679E8
MKIAFYGSSILSSYWNGAATYYRGIIRALAAHGWQVTFYEPDALGRQENRDIDPPSWCEVVVYPATPAGMADAAAQASRADVVIKASGVGVFDDALLAAVTAATRPDALRMFWDVDAPATLAAMRDDREPVLRRVLPALDGVLTYGGGPGVAADYAGFGAKDCTPVYNAVDADTHFPVPPEPRFACDLAFLGNRLPDREARVHDFFLEPARQAPHLTMLLGGSGWVQADLPPNVRAIGHVRTADHNAFNVSPRAVLNINRDSMATSGFSPPTRIFEAAAAGACLITDAWPGIETFLEPDAEVLVAHDGREVLSILNGLTPERAQAIGQKARARMLACHTYARRADTVDDLFRARLAAKRKETAA